MAKQKRLKPLNKQQVEDLSVNLANMEDLEKKEQIFFRFLGYINTCKENGMTSIEIDQLDAKLQDIYDRWGK